MQGKGHIEALSFMVYVFKKLNDHFMLMVGHFQFDVQQNFVPRWVVLFLHYHHALNLLSGQKIEHKCMHIFQMFKFPFPYYKRMLDLILVVVRIRGQTGVRNRCVPDVCKIN